MAETASAEAAQNVARGTLDVKLSYKLPNGGEIVIHISAGDIHLEEVLRKLAGYAVGAGVITLGGLLGYKMLKPFVESAVRNALGEVYKITRGSLRVVIHCLTVERFLKIVEDYESGRIKQCLQDELLQFGIEVVGLKVEIENIEEVNKTKEEINKKRKVVMMTEGEEKTIKESDSRAAAGDDEWKFSTSEEAFQRDFSEKHRNWLTVGELIRSIQKPISTYVDAIVKDFHKKLCDDLHSVGKCKSQGHCKNKTKADDLCVSCKSWLKKLMASHRAGDNEWWSKNCDSARWSEDYWEVAKFFMPAVGSNDKEKSTDVQSLLNTLEWMKDEAFQGRKRVDIKLVRNLRSQVRNKWAHAPKQEFDDSDKSQSFSIAKEFLDNLEKIFPLGENRDCQRYLEKLEKDGVPNILESELKSLLLQRELLEKMEEKISKKLDEHSNAIKENKEKLANLEEKFNEWKKTNSSLKKPDWSIKIQNYFKKGSAVLFNTAPDAFNPNPTLMITEKRNHLSMITEKRNHPLMINEPEKERQELTRNLPKPVPNFTAHESKINDVISFLNNNGETVVSLHGGPGFGKTAIAIEVSNKFNKEPNTTVIFSRLTTAATVDEMARRLCFDAGVDYEYNKPRESLVCWLKNVPDKVIMVLDDVDNLLEEKKRPDFAYFIQRLAKHKNCRIIITSRSSCSTTLSADEVNIEEMDEEACVALLKKHCCVRDDESLKRLAKLCGHMPLAMCVAASQIDNLDDCKNFCNYLEEEPFQILEDVMNDRHVYRAINMSYQRLDEEQKKILVRLAAFDEIFSEDDAGKKIEKNKFVTKRILKNLVCQSWIKQPTEHQYSINLLIKHFLKKQNDD